MTLDSISVNIIILVCCTIGLIYAILNAYLLSKVPLFHSDRKKVYQKFEDEESEIESIPDNLTHEVLEVASYIENVIFLLLSHY